MKLEVKGLCYSFSGEPVLENINMQVKGGEFVTILGPSGCGKSTLLNILAGLLKAEQGEISVDGQSVSGISGHFAYMPQEDLLFPWKNILDNVCLYGRIHGGLREAKLRALESFPAFGLEGCEDKYPHQLSGGMRQRAAFLRTALCEAEILLLDEPFGALDVITRGEMQDWLSGVRSNLSRTIILVTHDIDEAIYLSDRILILSGQPAALKGEFKIGEKTRSKEWLFDQVSLHKEIYQMLKSV